MSYEYIIVESYIPDKTSGLHGRVHIRPVAGQGYDRSMRVECAKELKENYPVGTRFKLRVKLKNTEHEGKHLYSHYRSKFEVLSEKNLS